MRKLPLFLIALFFIALVACGGNSENGNKNDNKNTESESGNDEVISFRLGHNVSGKDQPYNLAAEKFVELVDEKTNGEIEITIYPGGQLGEELEMLEMVQDGILDTALISASVFSGYTDSLDGLTIPFLFDNYETFNKSLETDTIQEMLNSLDELNLKGLGINNAGMRYPGSNVAPIEKPEDFEGLKIRVMESPIMLDIFNALGASPTPMAYGELYSALQTGVIDAHETNLITYTEEKFHEVTEYISLLSLYPTPNLTIINLETFDSLSDDHQKAIEEAGKEASMWLVDQMQTIDEEAMEELKELGKEINEIDDFTPFIEKVQSVYDKYGDKNPLTKKFIEEVEEIKN